MSILVGQHDHFEDVLEMVNCRVVNQFIHLVKMIRVGVEHKVLEKK